MHDLPARFNFSSLSPENIAKTLAQYHLQLTVDEALFIQHSLLKRPPTYAECVLWSIQGSEHCSYKSSRKYLNQFVTKAPHVILGPKEDAGIVAVTQDKAGHRYGIVVSHESHNHPSQLVPFEGAATGVGGNVRDVACMGAEVIAVADSLRFGNIKNTKTQWIADGVIHGIAGYANPLGIPNLTGDVYFDEAYNKNCLVTLVSLGVVREDAIIHSYAPLKADSSYKFILVGKPTDNSGFGGAAFASANLVDAHIDKNKGAVQEPNAFLQRHILKANYALFEWLNQKKLCNAVGFKDLGAGGIACASVELADASGFGADIFLNLVPTSMPDLSPAVILCSETQERFMWVVPEYLVEPFLNHYNERFALAQMCEGAKATVIGNIRNDGLYVVRYNEEEIVAAKACDITKGIVYDREYVSASQAHAEPKLLEEDLKPLLLQVLAHENIASTACVYEMYDKQVQGRVILERAEADAGVLAPFNEDKYPEEIRRTGVSLSLAHNPRYNKIDAYWGAINAVIEAVFKVVAVGARPLSLSDCLCFGNPEKPQQMAAFVESVQGIIDACAAVKMIEDAEVSLPIISGNVSFYNETENSPIPPSPIISCLGVMTDYKKAITFDFKHADSLLIMIGPRLDECGGSVYYQLAEELGSQLPKPDLTAVSNIIASIYTLIDQELLLASHVISKGGISVCIAQMSFKNNIGVELTLPGTLPEAKKLFSESLGFILEVPLNNFATVKQILNEYHVSFESIGKTCKAPILNYNSKLQLPIAEADIAFTNGLREKI